MESEIKDGSVFTASIMAWERWPDVIARSLGFVLVGPIIHEAFPLFPWPDGGAWTNLAAFAVAMASYAAVEWMFSRRQSPHASEVRGA